MPEVPSGTITLLFTDIEGSTRLQQQVGDGFFVAFQSAVAAVAAAVAAQRALAAHPWPHGAVLRVRMGLHSGQPRLSGVRYVGLDVHRAARIAAAAHGGQVLLSQATGGLVRNALPTDVSLKFLGEHRLKDLEQPEALSQLIFADLPSEFPPPRALAADVNGGNGRRKCAGRMKPATTLVDFASACWQAHSPLSRRRATRFGKSREFRPEEAPRPENNRRPTPYCTRGTPSD